jgi:hypothetical protein
LRQTSSSSSSPLARQPFVRPGPPQNYSPFFPIVVPSDYSFFGFLNKFIFTVWGCQPHAQPPTAGPVYPSSSGFYPSTCPAWVALPVASLRQTGFPYSTLAVIEGNR